MVGDGSKECLGHSEGYEATSMLAVPQLPEGIRIDERGNEKLPLGSGVAFDFWFCFMSIFLTK